MKFVYALAGVAGLASIMGCSSTQHASKEAPAQGAVAGEHVYYSGGTGESTTTEGAVYAAAPIYSFGAYPPESAWPDYRLNSAYRGYENHSDNWSYKYKAP